MPKLRLNYVDNECCIRPRSVKIDFCVHLSHFYVLALDNLLDQSLPVLTDNQSPEHRKTCFVTLIIHGGRGGGGFFFGIFFLMRNQCKFHNPMTTLSLVE